MNKLLIGLLSLTLASSLALAQPPEGKGYKGDPEKRLQRMQQNLGLSDEQMSQMKEIKANGGGREEMRAILTDEQRAKAKEMRKQHRAQHKQQHKEHKHEQKGRRGDATEAAAGGDSSSRNRRLVLAVGSACSGSSGQGCLG